MLDLQQLKVVFGGYEGGDDQNGENQRGAGDEVAEQGKGAQTAAADQTEHGGAAVTPIVDPLQPDVDLRTQLVRWNNTEAAARPINPIAEQSQK